MTQSPQRSIPFGVFFAALFFCASGIWSLFAFPPSARLAPATGVFLGVLGLALGLALLMRRRWARWCGALFAVALAGLSLGLLEPGIVPILFLLGAASSCGLLLIPVTGRLSPAADPARSNVPRLGRWVGGLARAAALGLVGSLWWAAGPAARGAAERGQALTAALPASGRVHWSDFGRGLERASAEQKPIVATFVANWCGFCRKMDRTTWKHPEVVQRLSQLVAVRIDAEQTAVRNGYSGTELARRYGVNGYPTLFVLDTTGRVVARTSGYLEPRALLDWLEDAAGGGADPMQVSTQ
jgi:thiol:disulfide interchange protein